MFKLYRIHNYEVINKWNTVSRLIASMTCVCAKHKQYNLNVQICKYNSSWQKFSLICK